MTSSDLSTKSSALQTRCDAVDALRGLGVLLLALSTIGARLVYAMPQSRVVDFLQQQFRPTIWEGLTLVDFCAPTFLFVAGMSLSLSFQRRRSMGQTSGDLWKRSLWRGAVLVFIGLLLTSRWAAGSIGVTWAGPFQQLGLCIALGSVIAIHTSHWRFPLLVSLALLIIDGFVLHTLLGSETVRDATTVDRNLASFLEAWLVPVTGSWSPYSLVTMLPSVSILLLGAAVAHGIMSNIENPPRSVILSLAVGIVAINAGAIVSPFQPCLPSVLSPSCVLLVSGGLCLTLAVLLRLESSHTLNGLLGPLQVMGRNSLVLVMILTLVPLSSLSHLLIQGEVAEWLAGAAPSARAGIEAAVVFLPAWRLYRRKRFITV